jgi:hypothetical protein
MDIWRFPLDAAYKMVKMKKGEFYPPAPIYKGYAVFKVLGNSRADEKNFTAQEKQAYREKVRLVKQYEGFNQWLKDLKQQAKIKVYPTLNKS